MAVLTQARVMVCFGTRPEVIKLTPVIDKLGASSTLAPFVVTTAQHREMLDQMLASFAIVPDADLDLMRPSQVLAELTGAAVTAIAAVIERARPDALVVQGDTTTAMCAALAGFYAGVPVGHVEAGLRSHNPRAPFPEEVNRRIVSQIATWHFCPTETAAENLRAENHDHTTIEVTGNTIVDALIATRSRLAARQGPLTSSSQDLRRRRILVTLHRRETQGESQLELCRMLARVARDQPDVEVVLPVHLSPAVRASVLPALSGRPNVLLSEPLGYEEFVELMAGSHLIVTDSGGIQEEASALGVPVVVMRDATERPEVIVAGSARLSGTDPTEVERDIRAILADRELHARMAGAGCPYGDGKAAKRIVARLERDLVRVPMLPRAPSERSSGGLEPSEVS
jgi:UDP-N-acetylglucosamine 2-epimerase (non-hydrolysing)